MRVQDAAGRDRRPWLAAAASAVVGLVFFGWFVTFGPGRVSGGDPSAMEAMTRQGSAAPSLSLTPVASVAPKVSGAPVTLIGVSGLPVTEAQALEVLISHSAQANATITFQGQWAAQLASKYIGLVDPQQQTASGSHRFMAIDIVAEHLALQGQVGAQQVLLLDSRRFGAGKSNGEEPYWVTVALDPSFTSADAVLAWCSAQFPQLTGTALINRCLPTQLTSLGG